MLTDEGKQWYDFQKARHPHYYLYYLILLNLLAENNKQKIFLHNLLYSSF